MSLLIGNWVPKNKFLNFESLNHQFLQYKLQLLKNLRGKTTVTFLLIFAVKGISAFELFAAHVRDTILSKLLSVSWKFTWRILVHMLPLHEFVRNEFEGVDNDINESESYNVKFTSGFELIDEQINV